MVALISLYSDSGIVPTVNKVFCSVRPFWWCSDIDKDDLILAVITQALLFGT